MTQFQVNKIVNVEAFDNMMTQIFQMLERQHHQIQHLQQQLAVALEESIPSKVQSAIQHHSMHLLERVKHLEQVIGPTTSLPSTQSLASMVYQDHLAVQSLHQRLEKVAHISFVDKSFETWRKDLSRTIYELRNESVNSQQLANLSDAQNNLYDHVDALSKQLECKIDKVQISQVETAVSQMKKFVHNSDILRTSCDELKDNISELKESIDLNAILTSEVSATVAEQQKVLGTKADQSYVSEELDAIRAQLNSREAKIERKHLQKMIEQRPVLAKRIRQMYERGVSTEKSLNLLKQECKDFASAEIERKFASKVDNASFKHYCNEMEMKLNNKTSKHQFIGLSDQFKNMLNQTTQVKKHVDLAMRFIKWFSERGDAYEHNFLVVENQLQKLVPCVDPAHREPFSDHARIVN